MEAETLNATKREATGTKACRRLRSEGRVPAIIYGRGDEPVQVTVPYEELDTALRHHTRMLELAFGNENETVLIKDLQYDAFGMEYVHVDFLRIALDEKITLEVTVELHGNIEDEEAILTQTMDTVEVECLPTDIPEKLTAEIGEMEIGDTLFVSDLEAPEGVEIVSDPERPVATVTLAREEEELEEELEALGEPTAEEPEVITREEEEEVEEGEVEADQEPVE